MMKLAAFLACWVLVSLIVGYGVGTAAKLGGKEDPRAES